MADIDDGPDAEVEELHSRLAEALQTCRSIVKNYREMLTAEQAGEKPKDQSSEDDGGAVGSPDAF